MFCVQYPLKWSPNIHMILSFFENWRTGLWNTQLTTQRDKMLYQKNFFLFQPFIRQSLRLYIVIVLEIFDFLLFQFYSLETEILLPKKHVLFRQKNPIKMFLMKFCLKSPRFTFQSFLIKKLWNVEMDASTPFPR